MDKFFFSKLNQTISSHSLIKNRDRILVGLSGGPDSICLFYALLYLRKKKQLKLVAFHINYGARKSATKDEKFCLEICRKEKINLFNYQVTRKKFHFFPFETESGKSRLLKINLPSNFERISNFENRAREIRYYLFEKIAQKNNFSKIAIAHNANDQAETVLINFLRGSGLKGIGGMNYQRGKIIRPLLDISRETILQFIKKNKIKFRTDETNFNINFTRNKIRHRLLKDIEKNYNPNIVETLARNSALYREGGELIEKMSEAKIKEALIKKNAKKIILDWEKINCEPPLIARTALRMIIFNLKGDLENISQILIQKTINYLNNPSHKKKFLEIDKLTIKKNGGKVIFERL